MKTYYEAPEAEVIDFTAKENLAVIEEGEQIGPEPEVNIGSRKF